MEHAIHPVVPPDLTIANDLLISNEFAVSELRLPPVTYETAVEPSRRWRSALKRGLPILAWVTLAAACSSSGETVEDTVSSEPVPTVSTTTTESVPTTEVTPATTSTTELTTTTSLEVTETTEPEVNINNKALCEQARSAAPVPGSSYDEAGVPNMDEMIFYGDCTGLPGDLNYGWILPGGPGYVIDLDTTGFEYDARGFHSSELPPTGSIDIPVDWDAVNPYYQQFNPVTLRELAGFERGTELCVYFGTNVRYAEDVTLGRVGLATHYNKYTRAEPDTYVGVYILNPDGSEDPFPLAAESMGVMGYSFGGWSDLWTAEGECKDLPYAA